MKRLLFIPILLLFCLTASAMQPYQAAMMVCKGASAPAMNTTDMSRGFEVTTANRGDVSLWTTTDTASNLDDAATGQKYAGSKSLSVKGDNATLAYQIYDTGATRTTLSVSFWFYLPTSSTGDDGFVISQFGASTTGTYGMRIMLRKAAGNYQFGARGTELVYGTTNNTSNAWYRVEGYFAQNAASSVKIYNAGGSLVDTINITASNNNSRYLFIGKCSTTATTGWGVFYWDDLGVDWADATTPLSPFSVTD